MRSFRSRKPKTGWDAVPVDADVVPGDVCSAVRKLGIRVDRLIDSEVRCWCPAHLERVGRADRKPSFSVNIETGLFNCWSCQFSGRFVDLVVYMLDRSLDEAVSWIRKQGTIQRVKRLLARPVDDREDREEITEAYLAVYVEPPGWALKRRRLTLDACERYEVLWDERREYWITPVRDGDGKLLGWQEKGEAVRYFNNHPKAMKKSQCLYGLQAVPERAECMYLVESPLDAVRLASLGYEGAVSSYGAGVSDRQFELILERTNRLVLLLDDDAPGRQARDKAYRRWMGRGLRISVADYRAIPDLVGKDVGEMSARQVRDLIDSAVPATLLPFLRKREYQ